MYIFCRSQTFYQKGSFMEEAPKWYFGNSCVVVGYIRIYESGREDRLR